MTIGELNRRIEVLELREERDAYGAVTGDWAVVGKVWAKIAPGIGRENFVNQQEKAIQETFITMRFYPAMSVKHRIRYQKTLYEVTAVKDIVTEHRWTQVTAKEIIDGIQRETEEGEGQP
jgi:SPP1 family predicted phage head-tail adaptor